MNFLILHTDEIEQSSVGVRLAHGGVEVGGIAVCRSKCTKNKCIARRQVARTHPILRARTGSHPPHGHPYFPWEVISCIFLGRAGHRKPVSSFSTLFRGSFEAVLPFFWSSDMPRNYPIRTLNSVTLDHRTKQLIIIDFIYTTSLN